MPCLALTALLLVCVPDPPPGVVLITLDTTRVDLLLIDGYERATSPCLTELAAESVRDSRAWSVSPWILPAHASLFTGLVPAFQGAHSELGAPTTLADAIDGPLAPISSVGKLPDASGSICENPKVPFLTNYRR